MRTAEILKMRIERLVKLHQLNAPGAIVASEAWNVFEACLAHYGSAAGLQMLESITENVRHGFGLCRVEGCRNAILGGTAGYCRRHWEEPTQEVVQ